MKWPKRATVEHFRDQVYRPRLVVLVLLCLLGAPAFDDLANASINHGPSTRSSGGGGGGSRAGREKTPTPGSFIRIPDVSFESLITPYTMPPIVQIHVLWALRFVGMLIEDKVDEVRNGLCSTVYVPGWKRQHWLIATLDL